MIVKRVPRGRVGGRVVDSGRCGVGGGSAVPRTSQRWIFPEFVNSGHLGL